MSISLILYFTHIQINVNFYYLHSLFIYLARCFVCLFLRASKTLPKSVEKLTTQNYYCTTCILKKPKINFEIYETFNDVQKINIDNSNTKQRKIVVSFTACEMCS